MATIGSKINEAAKLIKLGKIVAFPTETVYGLGADCTNEEACQQIFALKGRPAKNPLIVHVADINKADSLGRFNEIAYRLAKVFWPGPLTLVLPRHSYFQVAKCVTANLDTIALRCPSHPIAQELLRKSGRSIAAPSANISGYISATTTNHVIKQFAKDDIYILQDNHKLFGLESTILDLTTSVPTILRSGFISPEAIKLIINQDVLMAPQNAAVKAPGMLDKHYSPRTPIRLNATNVEEGEIALNFYKSNLKTHPSWNLSPKGDLAEAAGNLYSFLREMDEYALEHGATCIAVGQIPPYTSVGIAINDRLMRAAAK